MISTYGNDEACLKAGGRWHGTFAMHATGPALRATEHVHGWGGYHCMPVRWPAVRAG